MTEPSEYREDPDSSSDSVESGASSSATTPPNGGSGNRKWRILAIVLAVVLVIAGGIAIFVQNRGSDDEAGSSGGAGASVAPLTATGVAPAATSAKPTLPVPAGCMTKPTPIVPTKYSIDRLNVSAKVLSVGLDADGAAGAPPRDDPSSWAWFNQGPKAGSSQGHVILTGHTYHRGEAIGNRLNDSKRGIRKGDIIRLSDNAGHTVCYRYTHTVKVWVKDYDPNSTILYDDNGPSEAVIVACWDYVQGKGHESRLLFYADPVA